MFESQEMNDNPECISSQKFSKRWLQHSQDFLVTFQFSKIARGKKVICSHSSLLVPSYMYHDQSTGSDP